jgi:epsilon-lactone hydrolase
MAESEIAALRALLGVKPRPVGWEARRQRIDEVGSVWPVADDVKLEAGDLDGVRAEWSIVAGGDPSRVLMFFHGGGYCSGSIVSHRRMATEAGRAGDRRSPGLLSFAPTDQGHACYRDPIRRAGASDRGRTAE